MYRILKKLDELTTASTGATSIRLKEVRFNLMQNIRLFH